MARTLGSRIHWIAATAAAVLALAQAATPLRAQTSSPKVIASIELSKPFGARSTWRLVATQGPIGPDPVVPEETAPGKIRLCLERRGSARCAVKLPTMPAWLTSPPDELWGEARYLRIARLVYPQGASRAPLLLLQTASAHGGDGGQEVFTQAYAYRAASDGFVRIYAHESGTNNNQQVRYVPAGPLAGDIISAEPTEHAPFGFWITVSRMTPDYRYEQVLRYHSATGYNDGNGLAVIDSEMPNILQRLGFWRPGSPLPLPKGRCARPRLKHMELWCG